jgi:AcrR family transcriptional regulator
LPLEERRTERRLRLIDAALALLSAGGLEAVTVRGVCRRARLADRQFYEQVQSCDELLGLAWDHVMDAEILPRLSARLKDTADLESRLKVAADVALSVIEEDPRRGQLLVHWGESTQLRARREQAIQLAATIIRENAADLLDKRGSDVELTALILAAGIAELLSMWARGDVQVGPEELTSVLVGTCLSSPIVGVARPPLSVE